MAESVLDVSALEKRDAYHAITDHLALVLEGVDDPIAIMATISSVVHHALGHLWTGFYRVVGPSLLRVGPYQGTLGCLEIAFGRGVCGTAASERRTQVVPDVNAFSGHISCDSRSRSEIVVPVVDRTGQLLAVFDIDSEKLATFDAEDARALEELIARFF